MIYLHLLADLLLGGYVVLPVQTQRLAMERHHKVRYLQQPADYDYGYEYDQSAPLLLQHSAELAETPPSRRPDIGSGWRDAATQRSCGRGLARSARVSGPSGGVAQLARAPRSHRGGRGFESHHLHQTVLPAGALLAVERSRVTPAGHLSGRGPVAEPHRRGPSSRRRQGCDDSGTAPRGVGHRSSLGGRRGDADTGPVPLPAEGGPGGRVHLAHRASRRRSRISRPKGLP